MLGFNPIGKDAIGGLGGIRYDISISQTLLLNQLGLVVKPFDIVQVLTLNQTVIANNFKNISQNITLNQSALYNADAINCYIDQNLSLVDYVYLSGSSINIPQTLNIIQSRYIDIDYTNIVTQNLTFVQNVTFVQNNVIPVAQSLILSQIGVITFPDTIPQTLTLTSTASVDIWYNINDAVVLSQAISTNNDNIINITHPLNIYQQHTVSINNELQQVLTLLQNIICNVPKRSDASHTLYFNNSVNLVLTTNVRQDLTISQNHIIGFNTDQTIRHQLGLSQKYAVNTSGGDIGHILNINQNVNYNAPYNLAAYNSLVFNHSNILLLSTGTKNILSLNQNVSYTKSVIQSLSHSLSYVQVNVFSQAMTIAQTITLSETLAAGLPVNVDISQSITLSDIHQFCYGLSIIDILTITPNLILSREYNLLINDYILLNQEYYVEPNYDMQQIFLLVQNPICTVDRPNSASNTITFVQTTGLIQPSSIVQSLAFSQTNIVVWDLVQRINQTLTLNSSFNSGNEYLMETVQTISLSDYGYLNYDNYYELCHCLHINQRVLNYVPFDILQTITFTWTEKDVQYQQLVLMQTVQTNYDDIDCCNPQGKSPDKDSAGTIAIAQNLSCAMEYNCRITQQLNVLTSASWRP